MERLMLLFFGVLVLFSVVVIVNSAEDVSAAIACGCEETRPPSANLVQVGGSGSGLYDIISRGTGSPQTAVPNEKRWKDCPKDVATALRCSSQYCGTHNKNRPATKHCIAGRGGNYAAAVIADTNLNPLLVSVSPDSNGGLRGSVLWYGGPDDDPIQIISGVSLGYDFMTEPYSAQSIADVDTLLFNPASSTSGTIGAVAQLSPALDSDGDGAITQTDLNSFSDGKPAGAFRIGIFNGITSTWSAPTTVISGGGPTVAFFPDVEGASLTVFYDSNTQMATVLSRNLPAMAKIADVSTGTPTVSFTNGNTFYTLTVFSTQKMQIDRQSRIWEASGQLVVTSPIPSGGGTTVSEKKSLLKGIFARFRSSRSSRD